MTIEVFVGAGRRRVQLSEPIAQGAAGVIYHLIGEPGVVAKIYPLAKDRKAYAPKLDLMLKRPPNLPDIVDKGSRCVQIAWPTETLRDASGEFVGFVMPEIDFRGSHMLEDVLQKSNRQADGIAEFYGFRVLLAANLAAMIAALHDRGHYMIDMKPQNMRFYPGHWYMGILDTDGFSIKGEQKRIPADQVSDEYIAPEAHGKSPSDLGVAQDLFALAVILFRLLNNGIHPYQGISKKNSKLPSDIQSRVFDGLYAYGVLPHSQVSPAKGSLHEWFEDETRELFDRAFENAAVRPVAAEWRDHLRRLVNDKVLVNCRRKPNEHGHFSKGCGHCSVEAQQAAGRVQSAQRAAAGPIQLSAQSAGWPHAASAPVVSPPPLATPAGASAGHTGQVTGGLRRPLRHSPWMWLGGIGLVGFVLWIFAAGVPGGEGENAATVASPSVTAIPPATYRTLPGEGASYVNLRKGPGRQYSSLQQLNAGSEVVANGRAIDGEGLPWLRVSVRNGPSGYIKESLLASSIEPSSPPSTFQTSFDCTRASAWVERQICSNQALAAADKTLAALYVGRVRGATSDDATRLRSDQAAWRSERANCESANEPINCLTELYDRRTAGLRNWVSITPRIEANPKASTKPDRSLRIPEVASAPTAQPSFRIEKPDWIRRPSPADYEQAMPGQAMEAGAQGWAQVECAARRDGTLSRCRAIGENPSGMGFGSAGVRLARHLQMRPTMPDGRSVEGGLVKMTFRFEP